MPMDRRIRVLVVDDSTFMRWTITQQLESDPDIQVVGTAQDGVEALEKMESLQPHVATLDVEMPHMDGLTALAHIRKRFTTRVIMVSSLTAQGAEVTLQALRLGAVDFVLKPSGSISPNAYGFREELIRKVKLAAQARPAPTPEARELSHPERSRPPLSKCRPRRLSSRHKLIVIGSSTGGPKALDEVIPHLPGDLPASLVVIQHIPPSFTRPLAEGLNRNSSLLVREAQPGDLLATGLVLVAPGGYHLVIENNARIRLDNHAPKLHGVRPSLDITLESASRIYGAALISVVLTGMGSDGAQGSAFVRSKGGLVIAEDQSTCVVYGMPRNVVEQGNADYVVPLPRIAPLLADLAGSPNHLESKKA